jgi:hypothetical protein
MSANYTKYRSMSKAQLAKAIADRKVTLEYLNWLGISGPGKELREALQ